MKTISILIPLALVLGLSAAPKKVAEQKEPDWVDARYAKVKFGPFVSGHIATPKGSTHKGIAIRVGEKGEGTMVFDTDLCIWRAGWTGGFLKTDPARYGLIRALKPDGQVVFANSPTMGVADAKGSFADPRNPKSGPLPNGHARYKGLFVHGKRVVVRYDVKEFQIYDSPWLVESTDGNIRFSRDLRIQKGSKILQVIRLKDASAPVDLLKLVGVKSSLDFDKLIQPGPRQWGKSIFTQGIVDKRKTTFAIDTITVPYKNPHNAMFFTAGHDFTINGDCYVATAHGDVWKVAGIDEELKAVKWHRFATGLYQPLGLRVVKDQVYVLGRDQITRLHDTNKDGEADFYEAFNNDLMIGGGGHSYATCLETDPKGNFYFIRCAEGTPHGGVLLKVAADGSKLSVIATGFRNPNGLGVGPNGVITAADQQGGWVPETRLDVIKPGGFYGFMPMHKRKVAPKAYDPPLMWIPRVLDNSAGGQVWVPKNQWGPFSGELIHFSYGRCTMMHIIRDGPNGGAMPIGGRFLSGACRGRFNPKDGHLYVTGLLGWQTAAIRDGCLQRVRYTGALLQQPIRMKVYANGIRLTFSAALDKKIAEDIESWSLEQWNYKWTSAYGSKDWSVKNPTKQGRDVIVIQSAKLLSDGKSVFLQMPVQPVHSMAIQYNLDTATGKIFKGTLHLTINKMGDRFAEKQ
jgi:glucose/arabinose dehydrogenase